MESKERDELAVLRAENEDLKRRLDKAQTKALREDFANVCLMSELEETKSSLDLLLKAIQPALNSCPCMQCSYWVEPTLCQLQSLRTAALAVKGAVKECRTPPAGWRCSRAVGHEGPCAAIPTETP